MGITTISVGAFLAVFLGLISINELWRKRKNSIQRRMLDLQKLGNQESRMDEPGAGDHRRKNPSGLKKLLSATGNALEKKGIIKPLEEKMLQADIPLRGEEFLLIWFLSCLLPGVCVTLLTGRGGVGILISIMGAALPPLLVKREQANKLKKFNLQLVDALSIISSSLRAGYSFMQAVELVSREMPNPLSKEFARTFREVNLGTTMEDALNNMGQRISSEDLNLIVTAVLIQRQIGGNLAEIMDNISQTIRDRIRIQGEIKTLTAQGRISGIVIGLIPLFLIAFMLLINPAYLDPLFHSPLGLAMLLGSGFSELIGVLLIKKVTAIDF